LQITNPIDPEELLHQENKEEHTMYNVPLAVIESVDKVDIFEINAIFHRRRNIPPNPQININMNLTLPPGVDPASLPQNFQNIVQQLMQPINQAIPQIVQQEIVRQSPVVGIERKSFGGKWKEKSDETA